MEPLNEEMNAALAWYQKETQAATRNTIGKVVPPGYLAYARVLNPVTTPEGDRVRWQDLCVDHLEMTGETQWSEIAFSVAPDPNRYYEPDNGTIDVHVARRLVEVLRTETTTPESCLFFIWEGYEGLREQVRAAPVFPNAVGRTVHVIPDPLEASLNAVDNPPSRLPTNWLPADRFWCLGNDIHARSVFVGGSIETIAKILADPELEAYYVRLNQIIVSED